MTNSTRKSNSQRGGKRIGSGRKPSTLSYIAKKLPKESAEILLAEIKANQKWVQLASSDDERIVLETLKYLTDRAHGKASQSLEHTGKDGAELTLQVVHVGRA